ncbi:cation transporter [Staphylococcus aureus]|uniref:cation transporter n=1 Tax=Staphylococcus aureus TaxID=1280 RepID=UPI000BA55E24|nr:cation transporter [Staphylococcus aureus]
MARSFWLLISLCAVESALNNIDGVTSADVNLENGQVSVQYDDSKVAVSQMKDAIEDQGYDVV